MTHRAPIAAAVGAGVLLAAAPATAGPIPPPGAWPPPITVTANPLAAGPYALNGSHASEIVRWELGFGPSLWPVITQTIGRPPVLHGFLENDLSVEPITGATLTVIGQTAGSNAWTPIATTTTSRSGTFRAALPPDGPRRVAVAYWPTSDSFSPAVSRRVLVRVRSRVWLAQPVRRHSTYRFRGRVNGGLIPVGGALVALQVHNSHGNWITIRMARTQPSGRFVIQRQMPRGRFRIRAVVPSQAALPLYAGHSHTRTITR